MSVQAPALYLGHDVYPIPYLPLPLEPNIMATRNHLHLLPHFKVNDDNNKDKIVTVLVAAPLSSSMIIVSPPSLLPLPHPCGLVPLRAHAHQPQKVGAIFQQPIAPTASVFVADCCNF